MQALCEVVECVARFGGASDGEVEGWPGVGDVEAEV